jgi:hypothetical protein
LTFEEVFSSSYSTSFPGTEIIGLFILLSGHEDNLDSFQRSTLDRIRSILYENLSIADLEEIQQIYVARTIGKLHD